MYEGDGFFIDPEGDKGQLVPLLRLHHETVLEARIHDCTLIVKFSCGSMLVAKPDNHYESWGRVPLSGGNSCHQCEGQCY